MKYYSSENFAGLHIANQQVEGEMMIMKTNQQQQEREPRRFDHKKFLKEQTTSNNQHIVAGNTAAYLKHRTRTLSKSIGDLTADLSPTNLVDHDRKRSSDSSVPIDKQHQHHESMGVAPIYPAYTRSVSTDSSSSLLSNSCPSSSSASSYSSSCSSFAQSSLATTCICTSSNGFGSRSLLNVHPISTVCSAGSDISK